MTRQRMDDLLSALEQHGYQLLDEAAHPHASADPFKLENESVTWVLMRGEGPAVVELQFQAFGDLGGRTDRLSDITCCDVVGGDLRLYFARRAKPEWRENLSGFVQRLLDTASHRPSSDDDEPVGGVTPSSRLFRER